MNLNEVLTERERKKIYWILKNYKEKLIATTGFVGESTPFEQKLSDRKGLDVILEKISEGISERELDRIEGSILERKYSTYRNDIDPEIEKRTEQAFEEKRRLKIKYFSRKGEKTEREIDIYHLNSKYAIAFCHLRNAMRKFRLSRMMEAEVSDRKYQIPEDFDRSEY